MTEPDWLGPAMQDPRLAPMTALGDATRALMEAVVETDVELDEIETATKEIVAIAQISDKTVLPVFVRPEIKAWSDPKRPRSPRSRQKLQPGARASIPC